MFRTMGFPGMVCAVLLLSLALGFGMRIRVGAATSGELQEQIDALKQQQSEIDSQIQELEGSLSENKQQIAGIVDRKDGIDRQIALLLTQIENTNSQISTYTALIADTQEELDAAEENVSRLQKKYVERVRVMEEEGELNYWSILFHANSFSDFLDRINMIREIAAADRRRLQELKDARDQVHQLQSQLQSHKDALEQTRLDQQDQQHQLEEKRVEADGLLLELLSKGDEFQLLLEQSEMEQEQLMQELAQAEQAYDEALYQEWLAATTVPETTPPTESTKPAQPPQQQDPPVSNTGSEDTQWMTPVPWYVLTSPFGTRFHPILNIWRMHNGVDLACNAGTPIYASRSGVVSAASYQENGAGNYVQLDHGDGYRSIYMHMTHYIVSYGEYVSKGQIIGYVGSTGLSDGNHLHFGISYNGVYENPMKYIN